MVVHRGTFVGVCSALGVFLFTLGFLGSENTLVFWLFLELSTLCLIPAFFSNSGGSCYDSLFQFVIVSSISSSLILCGILCLDFCFCLYLGFLVKFGVFPFYGWVYRMILGCNWLVVWLFSVISKFPAVYFSFFLSSCPSPYLISLFSASFFFLGLAFWLYSGSWRHCWCHMMLSSSCSLLLLSFFMGADSLFFMLGIYAFWGTLGVLMLSLLPSSGVFVSWKPGLIFLWCWVFISFPLSLSIFYKIYLGAYLLSVGVFCLVSWVFYSLSEQLFVLGSVSSSFLPVSLRGAGFVS